MSPLNDALLSMVLVLAVPYLALQVLFFMLDTVFLNSMPDDDEDEDEY